MSARLLYSLSEENSNLQSKKGCINGIMEMIEGHSFLMGRSINSQNLKRIQSGRSDDDRTKFKNPVYKSGGERERNSPKFSRASTSSTSSSTATSLECSQRAQQEQTYSIRKGTAKVVIHGRGSSSKVETGEQVQRPMKHVDSPRPRFPSTPVKERLSRLHEPSYPSSVDQNVPIPSIDRRNTTRKSAAKDPPRLSFDERESRGRSKSSSKFESPRLSLDSRRQALTRTNSGRKTDLVPTELQAERSCNRRDIDLQLDLGSRRPISNVVAKLMGLEALPDYPAVNKSHIQSDECNMGKNLDMFARSSRRINATELNHAPNSPGEHMAYPNSTQLKIGNFTAKSCPNSRSSPEPVPRKQLDEHIMTEKLALNHQKEDTDPQSPSFSIYGEIEKRLSELDFQNSGTDLRALKQILEAMQKTRLKRNIRERNQSQDKATYTGNGQSNYTSSDQSPSELRCADCKELRDKCKMPITSRGQRSTEDNRPRDLETKQDKLLSNSTISRTFIIQDAGFEHLPNLCRVRTHQSPDGKKDQEKKQITRVLASNPHFQDPLPHSLDATENCSRVRKVTAARTSKQPKHTTKDELRSLNKSPGTVRNLKLENRYHVPASPSDSILIKQHNVQQVESGTSPLGITPKSPPSGNLPTNTIMRSTWRCQQGNPASQLPERDNEMVKQIEPAVMNQMMQNGILLPADGKKEDSMDRSTSKMATALQEQPSPVSVLDAAFYVDEPPSPVKKKLVCYGDEETPTINEAGRYKHLSEYERPRFSYEIDHLEPENLKHIDHQPMHHISIRVEGQDSNMLLTQDLNAEEMYLYEILLASGFMGGVDFSLSDGFFSETQAINPKLFCILEQTRSILPSVAALPSSNRNVASRLEDKVERRLVFDVTNETLVQKLYFTDLYPTLSPSCSKKPKGSSISGPRLLKELSAKIESLQANSSNNKFDNEEDFLRGIIEKDLINGSLDWMLSGEEVPGLALDVEHLIFKDLVVKLLDD
ncbi:LONGIFOLIA 1-like protein [Drosera capensis]